MKDTRTRLPMSPSRPTTRASPAASATYLFGSPNAKGAMTAAVIRATLDSGPRLSTREDPITA